MFENVDFSDIERRIYNALSVPDFIEMVKRKGVWKQKKEKRYEGGSFYFVGSDGRDVGVDFAGAEPSFFIVDECGPGQAAFDAAEKSYGTRTGRFAKPAVHEPTRSEWWRRMVDTTDDDQIESRRRAIRSALVRIPVSRSV